MTLTEVADIFTLLEAIAVVATLFFVALQIRDSNRISQGNAYQGIFQAANTFYSLLMSDRDLARIYWIGRETPSLLTEDEHVRFFYACVQWFCFYENLYLQDVNKLIPKVHHDAWSRAFRDDLQDPGFQEYWTHEKLNYAVGFQAYVDGMLDDIEHGGRPYSPNSNFLKNLQHADRGKNES